MDTVMLSAAGPDSAPPPPQDDRSEKRKTDMTRSLACFFMSMREFCSDGVMSFYGSFWTASPDHPFAPVPDNSGLGIFFDQPIFFDRHAVCAPAAGVQRAGQASLSVFPGGPP